jgi:hypothetical protein
LFFTTLDARAAADDLIAVLDAGDAADVDAHRGVELERAATVVVSGLPNITPIFSRSWLMKMRVVFDFETTPSACGAPAT